MQRVAVSWRGIERLADECLDAFQERLGFRPDVQLDWGDADRVGRGVADVVRDALDQSLARVASHRGATRAFVSITARRDTVEVCVVDDGHPTARSLAGHRHRCPIVAVAARGVEHDVDDFGAAGICQWWSIPRDLD